MSLKALNGTWEDLTRAGVDDYEKRIHFSCKVQSAVETLYAAELAIDSHQKRIAIHLETIRCTLSNLENLVRDMEN